MRLTPPLVSVRRRRSDGTARPLLESVHVLPSQAATATSRQAPPSPLGTSPGTRKGRHMARLWPRRPASSSRSTTVSITPSAPPGTNRRRCQVTMERDGMSTRTWSRQRSSPRRPRRVSAWMSTGSGSAFAKPRCPLDRLPTTPPSYGGSGGTSLKGQSSRRPRRSSGRISPAATGAHGLRSPRPPR